MWSMCTASADRAATFIDIEGTRTVRRLGADDLPGETAEASRYNSGLGAHQSLRRFGTLRPEVHTSAVNV
jgi:hypothetical protein